MAARVLPFVEFVSQRCRCPSSPDYYSPLTAAPSPRAASPEYTPVSLRWRPGTPEHAPSTALRLGPPVPPPSTPLRRAASPDYSPSSSPSRPASPEYTPLGRCCGWRAGSPDYAPPTPTTRRGASTEYAPSTPPAYAYRVASPEYTPVSRLWRALPAGSPKTTCHRSNPLPPGAEFPDCAAESAPPRRAAPLDYTPRTPPARAPPSPGYSSSPPPVSDAESGTSSPARRYR